MPAPLDSLRTRLRPEQVTTDEVELSLHARDVWPRLVMAERRGEVLTRPAAVVWPESTADVVAIVQWACEHGVGLVPFGGGTGVCGGAAASADCVTVDLKRMDRVVDLDEVSGTVTVEPGIVAERLERHVAARGFTLGHFPSSIHCSTIGGFLAVRSAGQTSSRYGKLEDMLVGMEAVLGDGTIVRTRAVPSTAAGPDLTRLIIGGEGATGIVTQATLRLTPTPEAMLDRGLLFPDVPTGVEALRQVVRTGLRPAVVRLYDETDTALAFAGQGLEVGPGCLAILGAEGTERVARFTHNEVVRVAIAAGGTDLGPGPGEHWRKHRHDVSYRFADYIKPGGPFGDAVALDTMEVAATWSRALGLYDAVKGALATHADMVLAHFSHVYDTGTSIYFTFGSANQGDEARALERYDAAWEAGQRAALAAGGTITHHHGIGLLRVPWLADELGPGGMELLRRVKSVTDPSGVLNPGKLGLGAVASDGSGR